MEYIDTHKIYKDYKVAGLSDEQADASVTSLMAALNNFPTKSDFNQKFDNLENKMAQGFEILRKEFKTEMELLRIEFKADMELMRQEFKNEMMLLRNELKYDIKLLEAKMNSQFRYVYGGGVLIIGVCVIPQLQTWFTMLFPALGTGV